jgi:hypothetical protein
MEDWIVSRQNKRIKLVLFTIFLGGMFWILESAIMAFAFNEGEFSRQFFFSNSARGVV